MFQKKEIIYSESLWVCQVENIVQLSAVKGGETTAYYQLRSLLDNDKNAYIPVENHQVKLRTMFSEEEARELLGSEEIKKDENLKAAVAYVLGDKKETEDING